MESALLFKIKIICVIYVHIRRHVCHNVNVLTADPAFLLIRIIWFSSPSRVDSFDTKETHHLCFSNSDELNAILTCY